MLNLTSINEDLKLKVFIIFSVIVSVYFTCSSSLEVQATDYINSSIIEALATFGIARLLNAGISVLQSLSFSIGIASMTFGEILDPINDLVEQFSTLMKFAIASLFIQRVIIEIVSHELFKVLITINGLILVFFSFVSINKYFLLILKSFVVLIFIKFAMILIVLCYAEIDKKFIEIKIIENTAPIVAINEKISFATTFIDQDSDDGVDQKVGDLNIELEKLNKQLVSFDDKILKAKALLTYESEKVKFYNRYFNKSDELKNLTIEVDKLVNDRKLILKNIKVKNDELKSINNSESGFSLIKTFVDGTKAVQSKIKQIKDVVNNIIENVDDFVYSVLYLMALFSLKTILLPILFIFVFYKLLLIIVSKDFEFVKSNKKLN